MDKKCLLVEINFIDNINLYNFQQELQCSCYMSNPSNRKSYFDFLIFLIKEIHTCRTVYTFYFCQNLSAFLKMKMKLTNKVHRNNQRKLVGHLLTDALNYFGELSVENLVEQMRNRSNRPIPLIYSTVKRTLCCGIRNGFILKRGNKFSLSGRNIETDSDEGDMRHKRNEYIESVQKAASTCTVTCKSCNYVDHSNQCTAWDWVAGEYCAHRKKIDHSLYCHFHVQLSDLFEYRRLFFESRNFKQIIKKFCNKSNQPLIQKYLAGSTYYYEKKMTENFREHLQIIRNSFILVAITYLSKRVR